MTTSAFGSWEKRTPAAKGERHGVSQPSVISCGGDQSEKPGRRVVVDIIILLRRDDTDDTKNAEQGLAKPRSMPPFHSPSDYLPPQQYTISRKLYPRQLIDCRSSSSTSSTESTDTAIS